MSPRAPIRSEDTSALEAETKRTRTQQVPRGVSWALGEAGRKEHGRNSASQLDLS